MIRQPNDNSYPVSTTQKEILLDEIFTSEKEASIMNLLGFRAYIAENCSLDALELCWNQLLEANDALRLRIPDKHAETQTIAPFRYEKPERVKVDGIAGLEQLQKSMMGEPILLNGGPEYRVVLVDCGDGAGGMIICFHHYIGDGYSMELMFRQLEKCYPAALSGEKTELKTGSYTEFIKAEQEYCSSDLYRADLKWWSEAYRKQKHYSIPGGRPCKSSDSGSCDLVLPPETYHLLKQFCTDSRCSLTSVLMTAAALTTARLTKKTNFAICSLSHGRTTFRLRQTAGCMVRTVPVFYQIDTDKTVLEHARQDYNNFLDCLRHSRLPFNEHIRLCWWKSVKNRFNFFHNWLVVSAMGLESASESSRIGLSVLTKPLLSYVLYCALYDLPEQDSVKLVLKYQLGRFSAEDISQIFRTYEETLLWLLSHPEEKISVKWEI